MYVVILFIARYGAWLMAGMGLAEFLGLPLAATPVLLMVGAAASMGAIHPLAALGAFVAGGLLGEGFWYGLARWRGPGLVRFACGLSSNPGVCVHRFTRQISVRGAIYLFVAKFVPGAAAVPAVAAGLSGMPAWRFFLVEAAAIGLWAGVFIGAGWLLGGRVEGIVGWGTSHSRAIAAGVLGVIAVAVAVRVVKARRHAARHDRAGQEDDDAAA